MELGAAEGFSDPDGGDRSVRPEKIIGEAAVLLLASTPVAGNPGVGERLQRLAGNLTPYARSQKVRARVCLEPSLALEHALAHLCLKGAGLPDASLDALLSTSMNAEGALSAERMPHRKLEQEWLLRLLGDRERETEERGLAARTALGQPADLVSMRRDAGYALTHSVMYATDLGQRRVPLPRGARAIEAGVDAMLAACLDDPDYDLGAELLLFWPYLRRPWSAAATFAFAVMVGVSERLGFLPSPGPAAEGAAGLTGAALDDYAVRSSYHTTFVMGLVCAAVLGDTGPPLVSPAPTRRNLGAAEELLSMLVKSSPARDWLGHIDELDSGQRNAIASLLMNIFLRRAIVKRDFAAVREGLVLGQRFGLLATPLPYQAAQLLTRAALLSGNA